MRILHVLPRNMTFNRINATSIDLFVAEIVGASRFSCSTQVVADVGGFEALLPNVIPLASSSGRRRLREIKEIVNCSDADIVVVQQHAPTAIRLASSTTKKVVLHRHNFVAQTTGPFSGVRRYFKARSLKKLSGLAFVSQATGRRFELDWPNVRVPLIVLPNGAYFAPDGPSVERVAEILCVGRVTPEKGILPAVQAIGRILADNQIWSATIILSEGAGHPAYARAVRSAAKLAGERLHVRWDVPHDVVRAYNERAAIALIPSVWDEPFGRTALEAHAGGAAVITSGRGGLKEISGPHGVYLVRVDAPHISGAIQHLIDQPAVREEMALSGFTRARSLYDIGDVARRFDNFLESLCD